MRTAGRSFMKRALPTARSSRRWRRPAFRPSSENLFNTAAVTRLVVGSATAVALLALTGCGSSHQAQTPATTTAGSGATTPATSTGGPGALQAEANATAAGD